MLRLNGEKELHQLKVGLLTFHRPSPCFPALVFILSANTFRIFSLYSFYVICPNFAKPDFCCWRCRRKGGKGVENFAVIYCQESFRCCTNGRSNETINLYDRRKNWRVQLLGTCITWSIIVCVMMLIFGVKVFCCIMMEFVYFLDYFQDKMLWRKLFSFFKITLIFLKIKC